MCGGGCCRDNRVWKGGYEERYYERGYREPYGYYGAYGPYVPFGRRYGCERRCETGWGYGGGYGYRTCCGRY